MQDIDLVKNKLDTLVKKYSGKYEVVSFLPEKKYLRYQLTISQNTFVISCSIGVGANTYFNLDLEAVLEDGDYAHRASEYNISKIDSEIKLIQLYIDGILKGDYEIVKDKWLFFIENTYLEIKADHGKYRMIKSRGKRIKG